MTLEIPWRIYLDHRFSNGGLWTETNQTWELLDHVQGEGEEVRPDFDCAVCLPEGVVDFLARGLVQVKAHSDGRTPLPGELQQGPEGPAAAGLDFDRDDPALFLEQEIYLCIARTSLAEPVGQDLASVVLAKRCEMLCDVLLGEGSLVDKAPLEELFHGKPPDPSHLVHEAAVQHVGLEDPGIGRRCERDVRSVCVRHLPDDLCIYEQLQRCAYSPGIRAGVHPRVKDPAATTARSGWSSCRYRSAWSASGPEKGSIPYGARMKYTLILDAAQEAPINPATRAG